MICPKCHNSEHLEGAHFCMICGACLEECIGNDPLTPGGYQRFPLKAPLILQPKDWTPGEWATLCRVCGLPPDRTAEIKIHTSEVECFTVTQGMEAGDSAGFLHAPRKSAHPADKELPGGPSRERLSEPFIWEPEDWTSEEWAALCKLCGLPAGQTLRILLRAGEIEYFLHPCDEPPRSDLVSGPMTEEHISTFKALFSCYCRQEINKGHCGADSCEFCSINQAYNKIFSGPADGEDGDDE